MPEFHNAVNVTVTGRAEKTGTLVLELPWPPTGNHATKHTRSGIHYKTAEAKAYRAAITQLLGWKGLGIDPLTGPLKVEWLLAPPDRRARDVDNVRKECADALTLGKLWADDSNKVIRDEHFIWTDPVENGKVLLTVTFGDLT